MQSCYQLQIIEDNSIFPGKNKKLIPNIDNQRKWKLNYQDMILCSKLGSQLKKVKQKAELQREAEKGSNKLKKQNAKLRNYAIFGKVVENSMNMVDV